MDFDYLFEYKQYYTRDKSFKKDLKDMTKAEKLGAAFNLFRSKLLNVATRAHDNDSFKKAYEALRPKIEKSFEDIKKDNDVYVDELKEKEKKVLSAEETEFVKSELKIAMLNQSKFPSEEIKAFNAANKLAYGSTIKLSHNESFMFEDNEDYGDAEDFDIFKKIQNAKSESEKKELIAKRLKRIMDNMENERRLNKEGRLNMSDFVNGKQQDPRRKQRSSKKRRYSSSQKQRERAAKIVEELKIKNMSRYEKLKQFLSTKAKHIAQFAKKLIMAMPSKISGLIKKAYAKGLQAIHNIKDVTVGAGKNRLAKGKLIDGIGIIWKLFITLLIGIIIYSVVKFFKGKMEATGDGNKPSLVKIITWLQTHVAKFLAKFIKVMTNMNTMSLISVGLILASICVKLYNVRNNPAKAAAEAKAILASSIK